jgi:two-component system chemotaxis response regulator CheB
MNASPRKIRVLIIDDSAVVRRMATDFLSADPEIEVVGAAVDPYVARDMIAQHKPDVLTLDLEMPRMDGLTFLRLLMERQPLPVVVVSSLSPQGSEFALEALRLGAVDVLGKPGSYSIGDLGPQIVAKVKAAAQARLRPLRSSSASAPSASRAAPLPPPRTRADARSLILLGASTGGTEALREVLTRLPSGLPPIAIVQHIPAHFSKTFANRLNELCALEVREAVDGDTFHPGLALVAPGDFHLTVQWHADHYVARVSSGPAVWYQRPAVDVLFKSAAETGAGPYCMAGLLTGMGKDGAEGLLQLKQSGAVTFAQDEATCAVFGMPRAAFLNGATKMLIPLDRIAPYLARGRAPANAALSSTTAS